MSRREYLHVLKCRWLVAATRIVQLASIAESWFLLFLLYITTGMQNVFTMKRPLSQRTKSVTGILSNPWQGKIIKWLFTLSETNCQQTDYAIFNLVRGIRVPSSRGFPQYLSLRNYFLLFSLFLDLRVYGTRQDVIFCSVPPSCAEEPWPQHIRPTDEELRSGKRKWDRKRLEFHFLFFLS